MRRRVLAAAAGALVASSVLAGLLALSPVRPAGLLLTLVLIALVVPLTASGGTRRGLALAGEDDPETAGRLAAFTAPVLVLVVVFTANLVAGTAALGLQQLTSLVVGTVTAAMFAARFSGALARHLEERQDP